MIRKHRWDISPQICLFLSAVQFLYSVMRNSSTFSLERLGFSFSSLKTLQTMWEHSTASFTQNWTEIVPNWWNAFVIWSKFIRMLNSKYAKCMNNSHNIYDVSMIECDIMIHRLVVKFNQFCKYPLFSFYAWQVSALSSTLVTLQFMIVEYKFDNILMK